MLKARHPKKIQRTRQHQSHSIIDLTFHSTGPQPDPHTEFFSRIFNPSSTTSSWPSWAEKKPKCRIRKVVALCCSTKVILHNLCAMHHDSRLSK